MAKDFISDEEMDLLTDLDPQSALASKGLKQIGSAVASVLDDGPVQSQLPGNIQEPGLQAPLIDPIDIVAGGLAIKAAPSITDAIVSGTLAKDFRNIVGNEIGAINLSKGGPKPIYSTLEAKEATYAPGKVQKLETKLGTKDLLKGEGLTQEEAAVATSKASQPKFAVQKSVQIGSSEPNDFYKKLLEARDGSKRIKDSTHLYSQEEYKNMKTFLSSDGKSGFAIKPDGDLVSVFSTEKGRGDALVSKAKELGASKLDAFDNGYLKNFYEKHGFVEVKREPNWVKGQPDVMYMERPKLTHYSVSEKPLEVIDPNFMGSGSQGRESLRGNIVPRSYYYEAGTRPESNIVNNSKTVHQIFQPEKILDLANQEAVKFLEQATDVNHLEEILKKQGFSGYKNSNHPQLPNVVAVFEKQKPITKEVISPEYRQEINKNKFKYAHGGTVKSTYAPVPKVPVAGLPVSAPEALKAASSMPDFIPDRATNSGLSGQQSAAPDFIPDSQAHILESSSPQTPDFIPDGASIKFDEDKEAELQAKYGKPSDVLKAALEGAGRGLVGPLAPMAERALGVDPEAIRGREEANPITSTVGEIAGLAGPLLVTGGTSGIGRFTQAGALETLGKLLPEAGNTLAGKIGIPAAKVAIDNMLISGSDEVSKMVLNDPNQSAETAIANIGLAGAIGAGFGGALGASGVLWKATVGDKAGKFIEDFKGRINEHLDNPDPLNAIKNELSDYYGKITSMADEVYGVNGLKAQDIAKAIPEMNAKIAAQTDVSTKDLVKLVDNMASKPESYPSRLVSKLRNDVSEFISVARKEGASSTEIFNATQSLKQQLQEYAKYDKFVKPVDEAYDFVRDAKKLAFQLKSSLEDTAVWGKAAKRQQEINKAFTEYLPALKDFEKKFTIEVGGEKQIDPGKINTYINSIGKPNAEIKQTMLRNFLDASEKYKKVIDDTHINLGIESPVQNAPMNSVLASLKERTLGAKVADKFIEKGLTNAGGQALGAATGASIGNVLGGHTGGVLGAVIGQQALGPFFSSILPSIARGMLKGTTSPEALKGAVDYVAAVAKGESLLNKATKNVFRLGSVALPDSAKPTDKDLMRLDKMLKTAQQDPETLISASKTNQYLPDNTAALNETIANSVSYLNSLRTDLDKKAPLDSTPTASDTQKAAYKNALTIAQQPLVVLEKIQKGTLTAADIKTLSALYPSLYNRMREKLTSEVIDKVGKEPIPYKVRIGLSMFTAQPLDSTLSPNSITSAQLQGPSQPSPDKLQTPSTGVKSSPALQKMPNMYKTNSQARSERAQKI